MWSQIPTEAAKKMTTTPQGRIQRERHQSNTETNIIRKQVILSYYLMGKTPHNSRTQGHKIQGRTQSISFATTLDISFDFFSSA